MFQAHVSKLLDIPAAAKGSVTQLRTIVDTVNVHLKALNSLGRTEDIINAILLHVVTKKLDRDTCRKWEESVDYKRIPTWEEFSTFLNARCQCLHSIGTTETSQPANATSKAHFNRRMVLTASKQQCSKCSSSEHIIHKCPVMLALPVHERFQEVKKMGLCINCLRKGHAVRNCKSSSCKVCSSPHHTILHRFATLSTAEKPISNSGVQTAAKNNNVQNSAALHSAGAPIRTNQVILATAVVQIRSTSGQYFPVRILLDSASQLNFVTESACQQLNLRKRKNNVEINGIGGRPSKVKFSTVMTLKSRVNNFTTEVEALVLPTITTAQPESRIDFQHWGIPNNIELADSTFHQPQRIDVLLGAEIFFRLLSIGQINLGDGLPTLQKTLFGWIIAGKFNSSRPYKDVCNVASHHTPIKQLVESNLEEQIEKFWKIDEVEPVSTYRTSEHKACESHFCQTTKRTEDGRFITRLPFKLDPCELGNSKEAALRSLFRLERMLEKETALKRQYTEFMHEYQTLGHMNICETKDCRIHYFIPHRCVLRPTSSTTKLRVVFNASCPTSTHLSLNDTLMVGPIVQNELYDIIIKFRCYKYAMTADITKMYRQILIHPEDRHYLGILWRDNPESPIITYLLGTVTYGTACAPFQATRCLNVLADEHAKEYPAAANTIKNNFYVDDMLTGADTIDDLVKLKMQVSSILNKGRFQLRKWASNCEDLVKTVQPDERETVIKINDSDIVKTLGLVWDPANDNFQFSWNPVHPAVKTTKRTILSSISSLFDPLGLLSPCIIKAKLIMQKLWSSQLAWDESLPLELHNEWLTYSSQLAQVTTLRIPRYIYLPSFIQSELHGFADASMQAYGCCLYLRSQSATGEVTIRLISSKSRVAPLKIQSLPRLELCGALLLAKLYKRVKSLVTNVSQVFFWIDSQIVLHWIRREPAKWNIFVANRVSQIQQLAEKSWWRHVPSQANIADLVSRGCNVASLMESKWFTGPEFLKLPPQHWSPDAPPQTNLEIPDKRKAKATVLVIQHGSDLVERNSFVNDFQKLRRIFAYVLRFVRIVGARLKKRGMNLNLIRSCPPEAASILSSAEIEEAEKRLVYCVQNQVFAEEIKALRKGMEISRTSQLKSLCPFLDKAEPALLRVGGRLSRAELPYDAKFPILLPKNHLLSISYLTYLHKKCFHAGTQSLVAMTRQQYWIISAKGGANQVVRKCMHCFHYKPKTLQQVMGDLPSQRIKPSDPFVSTGVDFCGPLYITTRIRGRAPQKAYLAVFVCFVTKATHLEVVSDLSSEAFLLALKRFVARRGLCQTIFCDNATNFVGARSKLAELHNALFNQQGKNKLLQMCTEEKITFSFIPPRSPHFGGLWESTVKAAKFHLYRVMHQSLLSFEELTTLAAQVEAILNSRPLLSLSSDPNNEEVLTPGHFLIGRPLTAIPEPDMTSVKSSLLSRWQRVQVLQQHFWKRWVQEYIPQLQQRHKWSSTSPDVKANTLVLIADDNQPPQRWLLGRILQTYPGEDGHVRVVDVKTKKGVLRRAITKLAPLPIDEN